MREKVVIIGGGISGLTAAHELSERGFNVHLYERRSYLGGKAASTRVGPDRLPAEHGYRFFPGWYRHLADTMARIPYRGDQKTNAKSTAFDNLVALDENQLEWNNRPPIDLLLRLPRRSGDLTHLATVLTSINGLGLTSDELALFTAKMSRLALMSDEQRLAELEDITWWEYLECDQDKTEAYRSLVRASTSTSIAAKADQVSAYTIGRLALRSFYDVVVGADRILNGPTSEVWIDPWVDVLEANGVVFHRGYDLKSITFAADRPEVESVELVPVDLDLARRLRRLLSRFQKAPAGVSPSPEETEAISRIQAELQMRRHCPSEEGSLPESVLDLAVALDPELPNKRQLEPLIAAIRGAEDSLHTRHESGTGVHFIFALPLEQMAYYVARSPMAIAHDPDLRNLIRLSGHLDWMAGIQFYLQTRAALPIGHIVGAKTPWALTAIEQIQHWKDVTVPAQVQSIISVDISMWREKGDFVKKEAFNCTNLEIATEVWHQLEGLLNRQQGRTVLRPNMLRRGPGLRQNVNFCLDENIVDIFDRKKQAAYERVRSLAFSAADLMETGDFADSYMWGPRAKFNAEPLLINRPGSARLRPSVTSRIRNMFLAGDYVQTETDLACMEGANEAGRRAANAFLDAIGAADERCELWDFSIAQDVWGGMARQTSIGLAVAAVTAAREAVTTLKDRVFQSLGKGILDRRNRRLP